MKKAAWLAILFTGLIFTLASACSPATASSSLPIDQMSPENAQVETAASQVGGCPQTGSGEPCPSGEPSRVVVIATLIPSTLTSPSPIPLSPTPSSPTLTSPEASLPEATPEQQLEGVAATPCPPEQCAYSGVFTLQRPIAQPGNDQIEPTYRFGTTQGGLRDPHHGVEFLNPYGTPVLAAADGVVVVAGDDQQPISPAGSWPPVYYGAYTNFYGNMVVIEHELPLALQQAAPEMPGPLYTLYAHLSKMNVEVGDQVRTGQEIGKVGMGGAATGSHLHFEVRMGVNDYLNSRNPELYLAPHTGEGGQLLGGFAGQVVDSQGFEVELPEITLQHLPDGPDQPKDAEFYLQSYQDESLTGNLPWGETFALGDLPPGWYRMTFAHLGVNEVLFQVFPGMLTVLRIEVAD